MTTTAPEWLLAIDPGPTQSGWVILDRDNRVEDAGVSPNWRNLDRVISWPKALAVEMIASYGMPVGREVFETCVWIGRFIQASREPDTVTRVTRTDVKLHLCGTARAKDGNVRAVLLDLIGPKGTKANPGPTYKVSRDAWAALGVAATVRGLR